MLKPALPRRAAEKCSGQPGLGAMGIRGTFAKAPEFTASKALVKGA